MQSRADPGLHPKREAPPARLSVFMRWLLETPPRGFQVLAGIEEFDEIHKE